MFNQVWFLAIFLPIALLGYWGLNHYKKRTLSICWILLASIVFYSIVSWQYVPLMIASISGTFFLSTFLGKGKQFQKLFLTIGILGNIGVLAYFKYADFFISSWGTLINKNFDLLLLLIPLGLSFTVFQQITFLMDKYRGKTTEQSLWHYATYVLFFPQVIAGPIVHHQHMMNQFDDPQNHKFRGKIFYKGLFLFLLGATKKYVIADSIGRMVDTGWNQLDALTQVTALLVNTGYMLQIYFDFSGYTLMALGIGYLFGVRLPHNFDQPYRATSITDFWHRWHITLSHFLRDYVYFSLGGSRVSAFARKCNILVTFLISGLWHGAGWTFVLWGGLHGLVVSVEKEITPLKEKFWGWVQWLGTILFLYVSWILFRAGTFSQAWEMLLTTIGYEKASFFAKTPLPIPELIAESQLLVGLINGNWLAVVVFVLGLWISFFDSPQLKSLTNSKQFLILIICTFVISTYAWIFHTPISTNNFLYGSF